MSLLPSGAIESAGYDINNSLRFRASASAYLNRTPASATNQKTWTISIWLKRGQLSTYQNIFGVRSSSVNQLLLCRLEPNDTLVIFARNSSSTTVADYATAAVFRDPSAWYHIVIAVDTTQATSANRLKIYVNGTQQTLATTTAIPQNTDLTVNSIIEHGIGFHPTVTEYVDGYLTEVNFVDGQQLTPSSFGETDPITGVWKAKKYTGTYGTNGFYLPFTLNSTSNFAGTFNGSNQYLSAPDNTAFSWGTGSFTVEGWIKTSTKTNYTCIVGKSNPAATDSWYLETDASGYIHYGGNGGISVQGTKDVCDGNWHHFAIVRNGSTNVTLYIDGVSNATGSDTNAGAATGYPLTIGYLSSTYPRYFNGQISNLRIVKGTAVYTSNFVPSSTALTAITNTSILTLQNSTIIDNSTNAFTITNNNTVTSSSATPFVANITSDISGNKNNWFTNNINYSTSGTTYDAMIDSPTLTSATVANYATLSPLIKTNTTLSSANLQITTTGGAGSNQWTLCPATIAPSSGKWYVEFYINTKTTDAGGSSIGIGLQSTNALSTYTSGNYLGQQTNGEYNYQAHGYTFFNNVQSGSPVWASYTTGDTIGVAFDLDGLICYWYKNNTLQGSTSLISSYSYAPAISMYQASIASLNAGQRPFTYTPPTGYKALNTFNLPDSTIKKGNTVMDATLYTGTGAALNVTNTAGFKPDFVWVKDRGVAQQHLIYDSIRGVYNFIGSSSTAAESTNNQTLTSFNSNGFGLGTNGTSNSSAGSFVGWQWQAGQGTNTSNTSGSTTSTVSVNATAGFSVVTYTSQASGTATFGHGLGVAPSMIFLKGRNVAGGWYVYHSALGGTKYLALQSTGAATTASDGWNNTNPTSTVVSVGNGYAGSYNMVAYCWAEIAGFSRFGSYTGNGSTDGPFVYTGFRPKFLMFKTTTIIGHWVIVDTSRNTYNVIDNSLYPDTSGSEINTITDVDFLSNGFKWRGVLANETNVNGEVYIYAAFAENPFKNANAR